jgi:mono/diheme cytochrome c family protein
MTKTLYIFSFLLIFSCSQKNEFGSEISADVEQIQVGKSLFEANCSTCHGFEQDGIGPNLSGLTHTISTDWIMEFIKNPTKAIEAKDPRAVKLAEKFKTHMPSFDAFSEPELDALLSYLHTYQALPDSVSSVGLKDPISDSISDSGIRLEIEFFSQMPSSESKAPIAKMTKMIAETTSGRLFVNDQRIGLYEINGNEAQLFLPITEMRPNMVSSPGWATGMASFTFHPEFTSNGIFYTAHTDKEGSGNADFSYPDSIKHFIQWVLTEWKAEDPTASKFVGNSRELMRVDIPSQAHGMQEITFNPLAKKGDEDYGLLYIGFGDGGLTEQGFATISNSKGAQIYSSILRIDPLGTDSKNGRYGIPSTNPFAHKKEKAGEVYAYGFRNPNRIFWDATGNMFATDIGQHSVEEINHILPGNFYGWPIREGRFMINPYGNFRDIFELPQQDERQGVTYPEIQLDHDEISAIFAGYVMPYGKLKGKLIFGDIPTGRLLFTDLTDLGIMKTQSFGVIFEGKETSLQQLVDHDRVDLKFGQDAQGTVYIMSKTDGKIYRIKGN